MSWLAILLSLAALGGSARPSDAPVRKHCSAGKHCKTAKPKPKKHPKAKVKPRSTPTPSPNTPGSQRNDGPSSKDEPDAKPKPTATATPKPGSTPTPVPTATPTPTATPVYPKRTGVDLDEWVVRSSYRTLAAGNIDFNAANLGEDDHNLSVRGGGHEYGQLDLAPGDAETLTLDLGAGTYTLYCSLTGHEEAGMSTDISVR